ncbi:glucosylglycerol-phosphate synthase [Sandarakinorhabdus sp.]|uniref:glucosylglycerol-phosphate synthase n=1 Tax=Sandarakinorhabdus sp. TaxID=1916663 RepID=UPI003F72F993
MKQSSLVIVYHRQPYEEYVEDGETKFRANRSPNGIVPTLKSFFRRLAPGDGAWVAWKEHDPETDPDFDKIIQIDDDNDGFMVRRLPLTKEQVNSFYHTTSKAAFWPVLHSFPWLYSYDPVDWPVFLDVNRRFAEATAAQVAPGGLAWIHDYNLWMVPHYLRRLRPDVKIAFFHHTPFPAADIFNVLPWRLQILESLLDCDMVGFHIPRYAKNFADLAVAMSGAVITRTADVSPFLHVPGQALSEPTVPTNLRAGSRDILIDVSPVGVDVQLIDAVLATDASQAMQQEISESLRGRKLFVSVARSDYTKGTIEALLAFERLLERRPALRGAVKLLCVSVKAASGMTAYDDIQRDIEGHVGRINGQWSTMDWTPIVFSSTPIPFDELLAHYRVADLCLTTPLRDGMNLVAKEFVAAKDGRPGALVISEFAGCAVELPDAIYTNPNGNRDVDRAIDEALAMTEAESAARMAKMRASVAARDIGYWTEHVFANFAAVGFAVEPERRTLSPAA